MAFVVRMSVRLSCTRTRRIFISIGTKILELCYGYILLKTEQIVMQKKARVCLLLILLAWCFFLVNLFSTVKSVTIEITAGNRPLLSFFTPVSL